MFSKWADAGAVGVKTDYFEGEEQTVLNVMENIAVIGAKYHFMVLYHGCIAPGGECRPTLISLQQKRYLEKKVSANDKLELSLNDLDGAAVYISE